MADKPVLNRVTNEQEKLVRAEYVTTYKPSLLDSVPRSTQRQSLGIMGDELPFRGMDIWNAFEFTWLNNNGKPEVSLAQFQIPAKSPDLIESKSLKLYLGSFCNTKFSSKSEVVTTLSSDLTVTARAPVNVSLITPEQSQQNGLGVLMGQSLDQLDLHIDEYTYNPELLFCDSNTIVREAVYSHLLRSVCPMTGQPDFASVAIEYNGRNISHEGLLRYLISYREHAEFAEQIVERIFMDIMRQCTPDRLNVQARFTRRGGIDINPSRAHESEQSADIRVWRQ